MCVDWDRTTQFSNRFRNLFLFIRIFGERKMILFNHEIYINFYHYWRIKTEDDYILTFKLFDIGTSFDCIWIIFFNFGLTICWY